ncbi:MAG: zinc ribbon domain-containing protein [Actinobacteria bacterium]|nr:zinc ribbon domain-containing protein [Actinomycetota bacterium]
MAIINCPECGRNVSDRAPACPDCAYPIASAGGAPPAAGPPPGSVPPPTGAAQPPTGAIPPPPAGARPPHAAAPHTTPAGRRPIDDRALGSIVVWEIFAALFAGGSLALWWVAAHWQNVGAAVGGIAAVVLSAVLDSHARGLARRAAVHEEGAGRWKRGRADRKAVQEHAPLSGFIVLLQVVGFLGNLFWMIASANW